MAIVNLVGSAQLSSPTNLADGVYASKGTDGGTFTVSGSIGGVGDAPEYRTAILPIRSAQTIRA
ncbi:hypothetical protein [Paenibacillus humicus]|uniref:hypothetical protein n=1 Tax=Paenibacillus humicus TaxID=412861 RepID=UPI000FDA4B4F|nr:hypothetical protein [Paenibacillus humicus]